MAGGTALLFHHVLHRHSLRQTRHADQTHPRVKPCLRIRHSSIQVMSSQQHSKPAVTKQAPAAGQEDPILKTKSNPSSAFLARSSPLAPIDLVLRRIGKNLTGDGIVLDIASIALPSVLALAADPLTSVVDTAFVGHVGSVELAAVGVSISIFNLISKLFNVPLLNITTSFVAEEKVLEGDDNRKSSRLDKSQNSESPLKDPRSGGILQGKKLLPAIPTSLALAMVIGVVEAIVLFIGSGPLVHVMGIAVDSPMRVPAEQFLALRALGAPAIVVALAAQGTFRGFMDTKTPLYAVGVGNLLNAMLDPILMFVFGLGIGGAAIATVIADYLIAFILIWKLNEEVVLVPSNINGLKIFQYLKSGSLLITRTVAVIGTVTLATSIAARQGSIPMAGHEICLQVWLAVSLLNDALALAGQALLASEYCKGNYIQARLIVNRVLQIGLISGLAMAVILFFGFGYFCSLFTSDSSVLEISRSGILFVTASQPINALAFVIDGLYYGVSDYAYAAYSMVLVGIVSSLLLFIVSPTFGLAGVWTGLFVFMTLRVAAGLWRLWSKRGPWQLIWSEVDTSVIGKE